MRLSIAVTLLAALWAPQAAPQGLQLEGVQITPYPYPDLAPTVKVAGQAEMNDAVGKLKAGDVVEIADGTYDAFQLHLPAALQGTSDRKIVVRARSPQLVVFTGATHLRVEGRHLQLQGFAFKGCGQDVVVLAGAHNRLTRCQFVDCGPPKRTQSQVVVLPPGSQNNELDYNEFVGSLAMSVKVRADAEDSPEGTKDNHLHHNTFRDIKRLSSNGQEAIQLAGPGGGGSRQVMNTRVEHNLFLRANGDREAISVKGNWNVLRWNVFKDMDAAINLRGGSDCVVEGNVHVNTRPMRVCGSRHRIVNNYFQGSGIFVSHGSPGYGAAKDNLIANNTIVAAKNALAVGAQTQPVAEPARDNRIVNNVLVVLRKGEPVTLDAAGREGNVFDRNLLWSSAANVFIPPAPEGSKNMLGNPLLEAKPDVYVPKPAEGSPALTEGLSGIVPTNILGMPRSASIGAY
jgi:poly(beta-D-mannuronate) lyase